MKKILLLLLALAMQITAMPQSNVSWKYSSQALPDGSVELTFGASIADGFHLYSPYNPQGASMPLSITFSDTSSFAVKSPIIEASQPEEHYEEIFGVTEKYFKKSAAFKIVIAPRTSQPFAAAGKIKGQACNDSFMCTMVSDAFSITITPPEPKPAQASANKPEASQAAQEQNYQEQNNQEQNNQEQNNQEAGPAADTAQAPTQTGPGQQSGTSADASANAAAPEPSRDGGLWATFLIAMLAGLAAILTPCVFPMIPMTVSYFLKDKSGSGKRGAIIFGLSIIALYTLPVAILILLSALIGGESFTAGIFNAISTHWLPNVIFFVIFFIFALSFLGMFDIVMPSSIINRAERRGDKGGIIGIFFLAFVLVMVSFSCTGPIVGTVLVESASGSNFMKPIAAILGFSIAFAAPFTLLAFFPGMMKRLPKSGGWMSTLKAVLGFVELALGLKFLSVADQTYHWHILDRETYLAIWIAIGIVLTCYLLGKIKLPNDDDIPHIKVPRLILAIISLAFTAYMIPGLWGAPLKALSGYIPPITTQDMVLGASQQQSTMGLTTAPLCGTPKYSDILKLPHGMQSYFDYGEATQCAKSQNKPLLLIFTGHGCVNCRKMEENVWSNPQVRQMMQQDYIMCSLFTDDRTLSDNGQNTIGEINTEIQISQFSINAQPYYVILDPASSQGAPLLEPQGYNPDAASFLEYLKAGIYEYNNQQKQNEKNNTGAASPDAGHCIVPQR